MSKRFSVRVPADFTDRFASILAPGTVPRGMEGTMTPKYGCSFPATELPRELQGTLGYFKNNVWHGAMREVNGQLVVRAQSQNAPAVLPGQLSSSDLIAWESLLHLCDMTGMPKEWVFRERELKLLVEPFNWDSHKYGFGKGCSLMLIAVQVIGLDEGFLRRELQQRLKDME